MLKTRERIKSGSNICAGEMNIGMCSSGRVVYSLVLNISQSHWSRECCPPRKPLRFGRGYLYSMGLTLLSRMAVGSHPQIFSNDNIIDLHIHFLSLVDNPNDILLLNTNFVPKVLEADNMEVASTKWLNKTTLLDQRVLFF